MRSLRRLVGGWGRLTADARMTPSVLVVGAQRSGSTTLFRMLSEHPELLRPTSVKGTGYFDDWHHHGLRWYRSHFPLRSAARLRERRHGLPTGSVRAFEISGFYLLHPRAADRIARELPGVQVVAMLRDPVDRAHSAYRHEHARGFEDLTFAEALDREDERTRGELERLAADPTARSEALRHHAYRGRGHYADQLRRFVEALGPDRVHVIDADDFFADPTGELLALEKALGLSPWTPPSVERWNPAPPASIAPDVRAELDAHFAPHDEELARLTGRVPSWRRAPRGADGRPGPHGSHPDQTTTSQEVPR